jgi:hypothetical protein
MEMRRGRRGRTGMVVGQFCLMELLLYLLDFLFHLLYFLVVILPLPLLPLQLEGEFFDCS